MQKFFEGKTVAVTGASSGIGWAIALELAKGGAHVVAMGRNQSKLDELGRVWKTNRARDNQQFHPIAIDLRNESQLAGLVRDLTEVKKIDVIIQSAGVSYPNFLTEIPTEKMAELFETNLYAPIRLTRLLVPYFQKRRSGHIAYVGSISGDVNILGYTVYGATKAGIFAFADSLRNEMMAYGVGVSIIHPADVDTPMLEGERKVRPPIVAKISGEVATLPPEKVAQAFLQGIAKGKFKICPDFNSWAMITAFRLFPGLMRRYLDGKVRKLSLTTER